MLASSEAIGAVAGLATSLLWTGTALLFTEATRRLGATLVNGLRILLAVVLLLVTHRMIAGHWLPAIDARQAALLGFSGWVGLVAGDQALFLALARIGPRLATLLMTTAPIFAALLGWVLLRETVSPYASLGIALTVAGVVWSILGRTPDERGQLSRVRLDGVLLGLTAAVCQAGGLLLAKSGIGHGWLPADRQLPPQSAALVRMAFAGTLMLPILAWRLRRAAARSSTEGSSAWTARRMGVLLTFCGAILGPFLGVWMSLEAAHRIPLGLAQTLASLPPVLILPAAWLIYREHIGTRAVVGALAAFGGVALLLLAPR